MDAAATVVKRESKRQENIAEKVNTNKRKYQQRQQKKSRYREEMNVDRAQYLSHRKRDTHVEKK